MSKYFRHYFTNGPELEEAFMDGYVAALKRNRVYDPALFLELPEDLRTRILSDLIFHEKRVTGARRASKRMVEKYFAQMDEGGNGETTIGNMAPQQDTKMKTLAQRSGFMYDLNGRPIKFVDCGNSDFEGVHSFAEMPYGEMVMFDGEWNAHDRYGDPIIRFDEHGFALDKFDEHIMDSAGNLVPKAHLDTIKAYHRVMRANFSALSGNLVCVDGLVYSDNGRPLRSIRGEQYTDEEACAIVAEAAEALDKATAIEVAKEQNANQSGTGV